MYRSAPQPMMMMMMMMIMMMMMVMVMMMMMAMMLMVMMMIPHIQHAHTHAPGVRKQQERNHTQQKTVRETCPPHKNLICDISPTPLGWPSQKHVASANQRRDSYAVKTRHNKVDLITVHVSRQRDYRQQPKPQMVCDAMIHHEGQRTCGTVHQPTS